MSYAKQIGAWTRRAFDGVVRSTAREPNGSQYFRPMALVDPHGQLDPGDDFDDEHGYARVRKAPKGFR